MGVLPALVDRIPAGSLERVEVCGNADASYGSTTGPFACISAWATGDGIYLNENSVGELAAKFGWQSPRDAQILRDALDELQAENERLTSQLEAERHDKVVPLADVIDFFEEKAKRRPVPAA